MTNSIKHVAIIMDGNGRWATHRRRPRVFGHIRGAKRVSEIIACAHNIGIHVLTLYAFSTENWFRPANEIKLLFKLLKKFIIKERTRVIENNICFKVIGDWEALPSDTKILITELQEATKLNSGLKLNMAFGYGGRSEILNAVNQHIAANPGQPVDMQAIEKYLLTFGSGDVDLLLRTGGDLRISNFLLWQSAYAELYFTQTMWPDFTSQEFKEIVQSVSLRERRFGTLKSDFKSESTDLLSNSNVTA